MKTLLALFTVILVYQVMSQDDMKFGALDSEIFVPFGNSVWLNCSTPSPNTTIYESRLKKNTTRQGPNWLAIQLIVDDWENSTSYCIIDEKNISSPTIVMAYAEPSNVTIDLQSELEEGKEHTINCTVYEVAPLEFLTINIIRGEDVIDSKSYRGPHVVNRTTMSHLYTFSASRSDNDMSFFCEAVLQLGSEAKTSNSSEIPVKTYTLPEAPVITVPEWVENGASFTAECVVPNGFPQKDIILNMRFEDILFDATPSEGTVTGTWQLNATFSQLGLKNIICESHLFNLSKETMANVTVYELPNVNFTLSKYVVDLEENMTAACEITNKHPGAYGLLISVDGKELRVEDSMVTHTITASARIPSLPVTCTAYVIGNSSLSRSSTQTLEVQYPPEFMERFCPSTLILVEGKTTFSCRADGNPQPIVECCADGHCINDTITVSRDMSGSYMCQATNEKGNSTKAVNLTVQYAPVSPTLTVSNNATVRTGNPLNITCKSDGLPAPTYSWQVPHNAEVIYSPDKSSIIIHTAEWANNGLYTCMARNEHGQADATQEVTVLPDELNIALIVGIVIGLVALLAIISTVWYIYWKKGRKGFYELLRPSHRQCQQNGNIPTETPANGTTSV